MDLELQFAVSNTLCELVPNSNFKCVRLTSGGLLSAPNGSMQLA